MAIGTALAIAGGAAALGGGIAGAIPKTSKSSVQVDPAGEREKSAFGIQDSMFTEMRGLSGLGPGAQDVTNSVDATRDFAGLLDQYSQSGGMPQQGDINAASGFASQVFDPQRTALQQSFVQQNTDMERLSARLGRPVNDPILQAKLRTGFMNQEAMLNSQQGAFGAQTAMQSAGNRVNYASQRANVLGSLATQAFQNRAALLQTGAAIGEAERNFRVQTATRTNESGGGFGGAIEGLMGGLGAAGKMFGAGGAFSSMGSASSGFDFAGPNMTSGAGAMGGVPSVASSFQTPTFGQSGPSFGSGKNYSLR